MSLSKRSLETLLDLVEIKLSCMEVWDRDDRRELQSLELARNELRGLSSSDELAAVTPRRRGRPRANAAGMVQAAAC